MKPVNNGPKSRHKVMIHRCGGLHLKSYTLDTGLVFSHETLDTQYLFWHDALIFILVSTASHSEAFKEQEVSCSTRAKSLHQ